jgi:hypothetical protein
MAGATSRGYPDRPTVEPTGSPAEQVYRAYRIAERDWLDANSGREQAARRCFQRIVSGGQVDQDELAYHGVRVPNDVAWQAAHRLRDAFAAALGPGDDVYDDVYHCALRMLCGGGVEWLPSSGLSLLFRGQRVLEWNVIPSLFRSTRIEERLAELTRTVRHLQAHLGPLNDLESVGLAQHYSREADVSTWLLDVTWDPFVALFFASDGGQDGDVGIVQKLARAEWEELSAGGTNRLGAIHVVTVPATRRISAQRALFVDTSHPAFLEQIVPYDLRFRQRTGVVFEDAWHEVPVTRTALFPPTDEVLAVLPVPASAEDARPLDVAPAGDATAPLCGTDYFDIAVSWLAPSRVELDPYRRDTLRAVCEIHARMQQLPEVFGTRTRNLHRLRDAVTRIEVAIARDRYPTATEALTFNTWAMDHEQRAAFDELVWEVDR